ncbi:MAG TPA: hypothetical protein ENJ09_13205 [Planctomycetes bacterium]|nr:hypothetical protein [Planctomycetota bacterium]
MSHHNDTSHGPGEAGFEARDAKIRPLMIFGIGLTILSIAAFMISRSLQHSWNEEVDARSAPHPLQEKRPTPTTPLLQPTTRVDLAEHRAKEEELLHGYGWIDSQNDIVHIPVARAMELVLERGLPAREGGEGR